jgi:2-oxoglutarate ferredoxin oxidoreductase subunit delta
MMSEKKLPRVDLKRCKRCGLCIHYCPKNVLVGDSLGRPTVDAPEKCVSCKVCEYRCPDYAIYVQ